MYEDMSSSSLHPKDTIFDELDQHKHGHHSDEVVWEIVCQWHSLKFLFHLYGDKAISETRDRSACPKILRNAKDEYFSSRPGKKAFVRPVGLHSEQRQALTSTQAHRAYERFYLGLIAHWLRIEYLGLARCVAYESEGERESRFRDLSDSWTKDSTRNLQERLDQLEVADFVWSFLGLETPFEETVCSLSRSQVSLAPRPPSLPQARPPFPLQPPSLPSLAPESGLLMEKQGPPDPTIPNEHLSFCPGTDEGPLPGTASSTAQPAREPKMEVPIPESSLSAAASREYAEVFMLDALPDEFEWNPFPNFSRIFNPGPEQYLRPTFVIEALVRTVWSPQRLRALARKKLGFGLGQSGFWLDREPEDAEYDQLYPIGILQKDIAHGVLLTASQCRVDHPEEWRKYRDNLQELWEDLRNRRWNQDMKGKLLFMDDDSRDLYHRMVYADMVWD